jgi:pSer/pThr/pTyr-binding forkhead associated (FHA) protein
MAASVCFSCGQPLPANVASQGAAAPYPLTGQLGAMPLTPPPNPYASGGFKLVGASVSHTIRPGGEVRVGRDPARCAITLNEPRVSGLHATLKLDGGQLWVRDETSNNGTFVAGARIAPGAWVVVPPGSQLRFGPISFDVQTDG